MPVPNRAHSRALLSLSLLAPLLACGGAGEARTTTKGRPGRGGPTTTPVEIALAEYGRVSRTSTVAGIIEPVRVVGVNAQLAGALDRVRVLEGARVAEGDTLASIVVPELDAQLQSGEAALEYARSTAARSEELFKGRIITAAEVERDRAALAAARSTLAALQARLAYATVRAPMAGVITERSVETGDIVSPNQRLFTIADVSTLVTRVQVSELEVGALSPGQEVKLTVDAVPDVQFSGRIRRIFPSADSTTRMIPVEVALTGQSTSRLRPGYTARTTFHLQSRNDALLVPVRAVQGGAGSQTVYVVREGKPARQPVRTGAEVDGRVEIVDGLKVGDTVIVAGATEVREGGSIRIVEPLAPDEAGGSSGARTAPMRDTSRASGQEKR